LRRGGEFGYHESVERAGQATCSEATVGENWLRVVKPDIRGLSVIRLASAEPGLRSPEFVLEVRQKSNAAVGA